MADKIPLKYENAQHTPFVAGDTIPTWAYDLLAKLIPGEGVEITRNPDGTITITNTCCGD